MKKNRSDCKEMVKCEMLDLIHLVVSPFWNLKLKLNSLCFGTPFQQHFSHHVGKKIKTFSIKLIYSKAKSEW